MFREKLAVIIPTKDRPNELKRLLETIATQEIRPIQIVIVDGGNMPVEGLVKRFSELNIDYMRLIPPSLTAQRNAGIRRVMDEATLVAFLDDDIILGDECLKNMMKFWETASKDIAGAAFNNINETFNKPGLIEKIFFVNTERPGRILRSGFQSRPCPIKEDTEVEWLAGFGMVFRRSIFNEFTFDEQFRGYARYEDVDFSYRVSKKYKLFIVREAKLKHLNNLENIDFSFSLGKMQVSNRLYFVKKNSGLLVSLCCWACFGLFLNNIIKGLMRCDQRYILRSKGNMVGFFSCMLRIKNE